MNFVKNSQFHISFLLAFFDIPKEYHWMIITGAIVIFIAALGLSIYFIFKENKQLPESMESDKFGTKKDKNNIVILRTAFLAKEKADSYLHRLEELKSQRTVNEPLYTTLKSEYDKSKQEAISKINSIQKQFQNLINIRINELNKSKHEIATIEEKLANQKILSPMYVNRKKNLTARISHLESHISNLKMVANARGSTDLLAVTDFSWARNASIFTRIRPKPELLPANSNIDSSISKDRSQTPEMSPATSAPIKVTDLKVLPDAVVQGNEIGVVATVVNNQDKAIKYQAVLRVNGDISQAQEIYLPGRASREITFIINTNKPGDFSIELEDLHGKFKVLPLPD